MFIGTPGDRFPHRLSDLGGVRVVLFGAELPDREQGLLGSMRACGVVVEG